MRGQPFTTCRDAEGVSWRLRRMSPHVTERERGAGACSDVQPSLKATAQKTEEEEGCRGGLAREEEEEQNAVGKEGGERHASGKGELEGVSAQRERARAR